MTAVPKLTLQVAFTTSPSSGSPVWTDLSNRLGAVTTRVGRPYELSAGETGELTLTLRNDDGALDPTNTSSPYYPNVLPLRQVRVQATVGTSTVQLFNGYVERWPMADRLRNVLWSQVRAFDAFAVLAQRTLRDYYSEVVLNRGPVAYYPLQESAASGGALVTMFSNATTAGLPGVSITPAAGGAVAAPGGSCALFETTSGVGFTATGGGSYLRLPPGANPPVPNGSAYTGAAVEAWFQAPSAPGATGAVVTFGNPGFSTFVFGSGGVGAHTQPGMPLLEVVVTAAGTAQALSGLGVALAAGPVQNPNAVTSSASVCDGRSHHLVAVLDSSGANTMLRLFVDGVEQSGAVSVGTTASLTANGATTPTGNTVTVGGGGPDYQNAPYKPLTGVVAHVATWNTASINVAGRYTSGRTGDPVKFVGSRLATLVGFAAPFPLGVTAITGGGNSTDLVGPAAGLAGTTLLDAMQQTASAFGGVLSVDPTQGLIYADRNYRWTQTAAGTVFGDSGGTGEFPFDEGVGFDFDTQYVYNDVTITNTTSGQSVRVADTASQGNYLTRVMSSQGRYSLDAVAAERAGWLLATYKQPRTRPMGLVFSPAALGGTALSTFAQLTPGTRVKVRRRPFGVAGRAITVDAFVEGVRHTITPQAWQTAVDVSPAGLQPCIADDATYGLCDNSNYPAAY